MTGACYRGQTPRYLHVWAATPRYSVRYTVANESVLQPLPPGSVPNTARYDRTRDIWRVPRTLPIPLVIAAKRLFAATKHEMYRVHSSPILPLQPPSDPFLLCDYDPSKPQVDIIT
ncbi:hypothetical protein J6590_001971 [Homalodisca vitripennis]|nr:hypothetical protein J6590_001971 [Homalodisca vitripennis]